jgi:RimJ/RimL family protein N-acetyltransferase
MIPILTTQRLRLRGHCLDDFAASAAMWADPIVTRYITGRPCTEEESWARFLRQMGHWTCMPFGYWVVEERSSGDFVGEVGFADFKRDIQPSMQGVPELGWVLVPRFHRRGYATEAVTAALDWGQTHLPSFRTACIIHPDNAASIRVAQKVGFRRECETTYKNERTIVFMRSGTARPRAGH